MTIIAAIIIVLLIAIIILLFLNYSEIHAQRRLFEYFLRVVEPGMAADSQELHDLEVDEATAEISQVKE